MAIVKMKKLRLMVVSSEREELLDELMRLGCVEVSEPSAMQQDDGLLDSLTRLDGAELARCCTDYSTISNGLGVLGKYSPDKKKFLSPLPEVSESELLDDSSLPECIALAKKISEIDDEIRRLTADESRKRAEIESLMPWRELNLPFERTTTETSAAVLSTLPAAVTLSDAEAAIAAVTEKAQIFKISADKNLSYIALVCYKDDLEEAMTALRPLGFSLMVFNEMRGTPAENIAALEKELVALDAEKTRLSGLIASEAPRRAELKLRSDTLATQVGKAESAARLLCTDSVTCLAGWVPEENEQSLIETLGRYDCAWETEDADPEKPEEVPIKIKSNALTRPYNMVTEMYSLPAYNGIDANPLVMPFFSLFFGIMFADMAYGIMIFLAGIIVMKMKKPKGTMGYMMGLLVQCGITTFIFGFLTGGFFSDALTVIAGLFGKEFALWAAISPLDDPLTILVLAMCIGAVHLLFGMCVSIYLQARDGQLIDAVFNEIAWIIIFAGLALFVLGIGNIGGYPSVLIVGALMALFGGTRGKTGFGKITGMFDVVYSGVTGYFGDILSYSRLMALMLAGSVIGSVFNKLGALAGSIIVFIPIFLIGHALNIGLNIIGCFVHTVRLQYLEFFGKFYRDGGKPFRPLTIQTKFVDIKED